MGDGINSLQCFIRLLKPWLVISCSERNSLQADFPALLLSHWSKWTYNSWHHIRSLPFLVWKRFRNSQKDYLFEASSGPESLKRKLHKGFRYIHLHVHTIPHAHNLAIPAGDTRKHKSNMLISKIKKNWAFSIKCSAVHIQLETISPDPLSSRKLCPVPWITLEGCTTLIYCWLHKETWGRV